MKLEKFISNNDDLGEDHVQTSDVTPLRDDAFEKSDDHIVLSFMVCDYLFLLF